MQLQQGEATSDGWNWTQLGEAVGPVLLFPGISLQEVGVFDLANLNLTESAPLRLLFLTNSAYPLGLEIATYELALAETFQVRFDLTTRASDLDILLSSPQFLLILRSSSEPCCLSLSTV